MDNIPDTIYIGRMDYEGRPAKSMIWEASPVWDNNVEYRRVGECVWQPTNAIKNHFETECAKTRWYTDDEFCGCGNRIVIQVSDNG